VSASNSNDDRTATATCATGYVVSGGFILGGAETENLHITASYPSNATTWTVLASEPDIAPAGGDWTLQAYAICAG
jgi:hypothetical protein